MRRRLICGAVIVATLIAGRTATTAGANSESSHPSLLQRFLSFDQTAPQYRALRHIKATNSHASAWMDVWTEVDSAGFRYTVVGEGGSSFVRSRVFESAREAERDLWRGDTARASITSDNYEVGESDSPGDSAVELGRDPPLTSAACIGVKPRRNDVLLVDGSIFLRPDDGDLVGITGSLAKSPSFWARRVDIVRRYARVGGVRVPVAFESVASVRFAGTSTLTMTYEYETVNGRPVSAESMAASNANNSRPVQR